jgi:hypothetical protein
MGANPVLKAAKAVWRFTVPEPLRKEIRQRRQAIRERRVAAETRQLPDRQFMESEIFPWLAGRGTKTLLSIGCRVYTDHYERVLAGHGIELTTSDIDPSARPYGAARHVTADVTLLKPSDFDGPFDAILFNGVIGFGLNEQPFIDNGLAALAQLVSPGAPLISGWNIGRGFEPDAQVYGKAGFDEAPGPTGRSRVRFEGVTHVYDFLQRRSV